MSDIELVIKINEDIAHGIKNGENDEPRNIVRGFQATIADAIKNGKPLPKGHGDLIDRNDVSLMTVHIIDGVFVCNAPTIIEADKGESEG